MALLNFSTGPRPATTSFIDEHSQTGVAGYGYFSYYNGFQINAEGMPLTTQISDPCINPTNPAPSTSVHRPVAR